MNKKNIVYLACSIDGYIAGVNGEIDWLIATPNPDQNDMGFFKLMDEVDALLMGRSTFDILNSFDVDWPYTKHVFVLSNTLKELPAKYEGKASLISGSSQQILNTLHARGYYCLYIDGGVTVQNFLEDDLIDELIITRLPIVLGEGIPLFRKLDRRVAFEHKKTEVFLGELVQSHYIRKR